VNQRRGLGRGLGALIPSSTPKPEQHPEGTEAADLTGSRDAPPVPAVQTAANASDPHPVDAFFSASPVAADPVDDAGLQSVEGVRYAEIPLDDITPNPRQPREVFDEDALAELVFSIREIGLLQPVVVRPAGPDSSAPFELVAGERRWRASRLAGLERIPAIIRETADDVLLRDALLENLHRAQLNALEEAAAYQQLLDDFGCTQEELATRIGRSRPQVSNTLRLLRLPAPVQRRVAAGVLSAGHARALLALDDTDAMDRLATRIVAEGLSVRSVEEIVAIGEADGRERVRVSRPRSPSMPGLSDIAARLSDRLETRVKVEAGKSKGKVSIEFATLDDLRRIVDIIDRD
jgi:ParB family chromosome partitioning protein